MKGRPTKPPANVARKIWVDADVTPRPIMDILFRTAESRRLVLTLVASRSQPLPQSAYIRSLVVSNGFDTTGTKIAAMVVEGDLVVTGDAPLAQAASRKKAAVLNLQGDIYVRDVNAKPLSDEIIVTGLRAPTRRTAPETLPKRDQVAFASQLDQMLTPVVKPLPKPVTAPARTDDF